MPTNKKAAAKLNARNKRFLALTKAERRVAIAKDVLKQLRLNVYQASPGTYVCIRNGLKRDALADDQLCDVLSLTAPSRCAVCARGAMFLSAVMKFDNYRVGDCYALGREMSQSLYVGDSDFNEYENHFFSPQQIDLIESAFEGWTRRLPDGNLDYTSVHFQRAYPDATERLIVIMKNIIANRGIFKIPKEFLNKASENPDYSAD